MGNFAKLGLENKRCLSQTSFGRTFSSYCMF